MFDGSAEAAEVEVGRFVGSAVGSIDGTIVGFVVGADDGLGEGATDGAAEEGDDCHCDALLVLLCAQSV